jgi:hypothetical protein
LQIDPNLQRLQSLINSKQAQHLPESNRIGRSGNPKFAEAVRRAQSARIENGFPENRIQPKNEYSQSTNIQIDKVKSAPNGIQEIQSASSEKLIAPNLNSTINMGETTQVRNRRGLNNIGKLLDLYA